MNARSAGVVGRAFNLRLKSAMGAAPSRDEGGPDNVRTVNPARRNEMTIEDGGGESSSGEARGKSLGPSFGPPTGLPWGLLAACVGVIGLVVRYLFWELGEVPAGVTGGGIGLVVAGAHVERIRRARTTRPWSFLHLTGIVAVAALLSLGAVWMRPMLFEATTSDVTYEMPGLRWTGPGWEVKEREDRFDFGQLVLAAPGGTGRFIRFGWARDRQGRREELEALIASTNQKIASVEEVSVSGHVGYRFEATMIDGTKRNFATHWFCPEHGRTQSLTTFLSLDRDALMEKHVAYEQSAECHVPFDGELPRIVFPMVVMPDGFGRMDNPDAVSLINENETEVFIFPPALPESEISAKLQTEVELLKLILGGLLRTQLFTVEQKPTVVAEQGGERTALWEGTASMEDGKVRLVFAAWPCAEQDLSMLGLYLGPQDKPIDSARQILLGAACP